MRKALAVAMAVMMLGAPPLQAASCPAPKTEVVTKVVVAAFEDRIFFRLRDIALDFDGSPVAYGARDQGQENICVGITTNSGECRGRSGGKTASGVSCTKVCQQVFSAWVRAGSNIDTLGETMCSVGLGGGGCSTPHVRLQDPPHADFFVSETSLKVGPDLGAAERLGSGTGGTNRPWRSELYRRTDRAVEVRRELWRRRPCLCRLIPNACLIHCGRLLWPR